MNINKNLVQLIIFIIAIFGQLSADPEAKDVAPEQKVDEFGQLIEKTDRQTHAKFAYILGKRLSPEKATILWTCPTILLWFLLSYPFNPLFQAFKFSMAASLPVSVISYFSLKLYQRTLCKDTHASVASCLDFLKTVDSKNNVIYIDNERFYVPLPSEKELCEIEKILEKNSPQLTKKTVEIMANRIYEKKINLICSTASIIGSILVFAVIFCRPENGEPFSMQQIIRSLKGTFLYALFMGGGIGSLNCLLGNFGLILGNNDEIKEIKKVITSLRKAKNQNAADGAKINL